MDQLLKRLEKEIAPSLLRGEYGPSPTAITSGLQYHLSGSRCTTQLARLAKISSSDHVLDVCSYLGGPAFQLTQKHGCKVTGIDLNEKYVQAAKRLAKLAKLENKVKFVVGDAQNLPFKNSSFTVVWNQGSLDHDPAWLKEFARVLKPMGRLAITFATKGPNPNQTSPKWTLIQMAEEVTRKGFEITHQEDLTQRDIRLGWQKLLKRLQKNKKRYSQSLGSDWVKSAQQNFEKEIELMKKGVWGNGRIVAVRK